MSALIYYLNPLPTVHTVHTVVGGSRQQPFLWEAVANLDNSALVRPEGVSGSSCHYMLGPRAPATKKMGQGDSRLYVILGYVD